MELPAPTYDLVLILDPRAEDDARAKIVADTRSTIEAGGELLRHDEWGERALTYPIDKHANGEYHLLQFHRAGTELLSGLDRTLRITDGVLRFRIIKLKPGVPDAPDMRAASSPVARRPESEERPSATAAEQAPAEPAEESPPVPAAEEPQAPAEAAAPDAGEIPVGEPA
ncbi:MAG: 30S ribosomal protein S6 [Solirubrobacteraceae bacterium]